MPQQSQMQLSRSQAIAQSLLSLGETIHRRQQLLSRPSSTSWSPRSQIDKVFRADMHDSDGNVRLSERDEGITPRYRVPTTLYAEPLIYQPFLPIRRGTLPPSFL